MSIQTQILLEKASKYGYNVEDVASKLISLPEFENCSGSSKPFQHHYGNGGLAQHTLEVVNLCFAVKDQIFQNYFGLQRYTIDCVELFFAALFHDAGKIYDYEQIDGVWQSAKHKRLIHHISRSGLMWSETISTSNLLCDIYHDKVLHAILSHHGSREYGSPVTPKTRVAWLVHFCDGISARMYDADTIDIVKEK